MIQETKNAPFSTPIPNRASIAGKLYPQNRYIITRLSAERQAMNRKEIEILGLIKKLIQCTAEKYEENKIILLSISAGAGDEYLLDFLKKLFALTDKMRPQLIEMKKGVNHD